MLDVERRPHIDAGPDQLLDVLPAFGMARTVGIGVGVFVDEEELGPPRQGGVDVELQQGPIAVLHGLAREDLEAGEQRLGLGPAVGFHQADDDIDTLVLAPPGLLQHLVGLADPRGHP